MINHKYGFTIIEVLMSTLLVGMVVGSVTFVYVKSVKVHETKENRRMARDSLSNAIDLMTKDLASASTITTCSSTSLIFTQYVDGVTSTMTYTVGTDPNSGATIFLLRNGVPLVKNIDSATSILSYCNGGLVTIDLTATMSSGKDRVSRRLTTKVRAMNIGAGGGGGSSNGLVGWWKLDELTGSSTVTDYSGSSFNISTLSYAAGNSTGPFIVNAPTMGVSTGRSGTGTGFSLNSTGSYIRLGLPNAVRLQTFTLMCWFQRNGTGTAANTGTGGLASATSTLAEPLIAKLVGEADGTNVDGNYFLGIIRAGNQTSTFATQRRLAGDFEDNATGANHRVLGSATSTLTAGIPINNGTWYHAVFTFDGATENLYLNGVLEGTAAHAFTPRFDSIQPLAIGTTLTSANVAAGYFNGSIDDIRIYNRALTLQEISAIYNDGAGNYT